MKGRLLHISEDEKFINSANSQFEAAFENKNFFHIFKNNDDSELKYVLLEENVKIINSLEGVNKLLSTINKEDVVIFHSLSPRFISFINSLPKEIKTVWLCFGFEIYNDKNFFSVDILYDKITKKTFTYKEPIWIKIKIFLNKFYKIFLKQKEDNSQKLKAKAIERIDYLACSFEEEFNLVSKLIGQKKFFFPFWYYPLERIVDVNTNAKIIRNDILIGNSGTKTNNHLDIFKKIEHYNLNDRNVIVPLSYGDKMYIDHIMLKGRETFKDFFLPLDKFYNIEDYNNIIMSCGVAIFNNRRQQAVGNILALLWFGSKVFLSYKSTFYAFLKSLSIHVYSFENDLNENSINVLLSDKEIEHNRGVLKRVLSTEMLNEQLKQTIDSLLLDNHK